MTELVVGILVGGRGSRLGGVAKGLLLAPGTKTSLIERLLSELRAALPGAPVVLIGNAEAYAALGLRALPDDPPGVGPLGGVASLLEFARDREAHAALCLTCDLPRLERRLLTRLATESASVAALVTAQSGVRNPLVARYRVADALPVARRALHEGKRSVQSVLDGLGSGVEVLDVDEAEAALLVDWDVPEDLR